MSPNRSQVSDLRFQDEEEKEDEEEKRRFMEREFTTGAASVRDQRAIGPDFRGLAPSISKNEETRG